MHILCSTENILNRKNICRDLISAYLIVQAKRSEEAQNGIWYVCQQTRESLEVETYRAWVLYVEIKV